MTRRISLALTLHNHQPIGNFGWVLAEVFEQAGFPRGVFRTLLIGSRQVKAVIENPRVSAVTLTGNNSIAALAASTAGTGGRFSGAFIMGAMSGLVAAPCGAPVFAAVLSVAASMYFFYSPIFDFRVTDAQDLPSVGA